MNSTTSPPPTIRLAPHEERVARLFLEGKENAEIAQALYIAYGTVGAVLNHIKRKVGHPGMSRVSLAFALQAILKPQ